jgi:hypothetical protein
MALTTALLFTAATVAGRAIVAPGWPVWAAGVALSVPLCAAVTLLLGPTTGDRRVILTRVRTMITGLRRKG